MPAAQAAPRIVAVSRHWHDLAERRLGYYAELYRSGRWRHYYRDKQQFAARMLDVIRAAKVWRDLAQTPVAPVAAPADDDILSAA